MICANLSLSPIGNRIPPLPSSKISDAQLGHSLEIFNVPIQALSIRTVLNPSLGELRILATAFFTYP